MSNRASLEQAYLTFHVGTRWYAVDVKSVFEVYLLMSIAPVPDMPEAVLGIVNLRGQIVPVIDLRRRFKIVDYRYDLTTPIIFVRAENAVYGMVVDDVDDVINIPASVISDTPLNQRATHIQGLTDYQGRLIMLLDPGRLLRSTLDDSTLEELNLQIQQQTTNED